MATHAFHRAGPVESVEPELCCACMWN